MSKLVGQGKLELVPRDGRTLVIFFYHLDSHTVVCYYKIHTSVGFVCTVCEYDLHTVVLNENTVTVNSMCTS